MAGWVCMSGMQEPQGMDDEPGNVFLCLVPASDIADGRHDFSRKSLAAPEMVLGDVAHVHSEDGSERKGIGAGAWFGVLPDGLAYVAEVAAGHG